ncbi:hypothetical protein [Thalassospira xiamenensis]|uniref:hypothetical protein n=1 Tax=Thalassospira xiamenensis TaxID=220697 RepID=UPI003AA8082C
MKKFIIDTAALISITTATISTLFYFNIVNEENFTITKIITFFDHWQSLIGSILGSVIAISLFYVQRLKDRSEATNAEMHQIRRNLRIAYGEINDTRDDTAGYKAVRPYLRDQDPREQTMRDSVNALRITKEGYEKTLIALMQTPRSHLSPRGLNELIDDAERETREAIKAAECTIGGGEIILGETFAQKIIDEAINACSYKHQIRLMIEKGIKLTHNYAA